LLHLKLPPEIVLSTARASRLRVTFVLDFGVPQISIEVDGIQVQARLVEDVADALPTRPGQRPAPSRSSPPQRRASPSPTRDDISDPDSDDDEHVPTVDELAKSFMRAEPAEEIRELQEELASRSAYMQESVASSDDGDEGSAGMGTPLALPTYLRNILNTALDRLSITVNNIDVEVEDDHSSRDSSDASKPDKSSPVSLNFHIESLAIDSIASKDARVEVGSTVTPADTTKLGKRRMRIENICARLVSDAENFVTLSKFSQPSSPTTTRSEPSGSHKSPSEPSASRSSSHSMHGEALGSEERSAEPDLSPSPVASPMQASISSHRDQSTSLNPLEPPEQPFLDASMHTVDDDRFADAGSDDGSDDHFVDSEPSQSQQELPMRDLGGSSILYDDEGLLNYAMQNDMLHSRFDDAPMMEASAEVANTWGLDGANSSRHTQVSEPASDMSASKLPTVSALGRSFHPRSNASSPSSPSQSRHAQATPVATDNLAAARQHTVEEVPSPASSIHGSAASSPSPGEDLAESRFFTHDEAESMYTSAVSAAQTGSAHQRHVPGGWDSASASSRDSASDNSGSVPEDMITGSILAPLPETEEGCETPRPGSPQSLASSPQVARVQTPTSNTPSICRQAKRFLTIDEITVWFPLGLDDAQNNDLTSANIPETLEYDVNFRPTNLGEDSIFTEMPGAFSDYAQSSVHRRKAPSEASARRRPISKSSQPPHPSEQPGKINAPSISIEVGSVAGHMDVSTGRIMFGMFNRAMQALTGEPRSSESKPQSSAPSEGPREFSSSLEVTVKHTGVAWLENILTESTQEGQISSRQLDLKPVEALLRINLSMAHLTRKDGSHESRSQLHIGRFTLASLDQDIVSFQSSRPRSRRSISALPEQLHHDIEIDFEQGKDNRITIVTRPVIVNFDVPKLDDALGSFGGFSGILELSSSISSTSTAQSPVISPARPRPRGVHFGDGLPPPAKTAAASTTAPKIQVQFGEVAFVLKGRTCSVQLQTTSVRIAVRDSNVRLKISEVQLMGPYIESGQKVVPLMMELRGTTVNFLFAPEETDLAKLISMITPSKDPYENNDDILIDTLLRQRRKGSVIRVEVSEVGVRISDLPQLKALEVLGAELARLSKVTKYLPDDDRPGLLSLASVNKLDARIVVNEQLGEVSVVLEDAAVAHVGVPALLATEIGQATVCRDGELLIHQLVKLRPSDQLPAIMLRMVGDEMEPVAKAKFFNVCVEYRVSTIMAALGISEDGTSDEIALGIASSVATITGAASPPSFSRPSSDASSPSAATAKPLQVDLLLRSCAIGLNPRKTASKGLFVLTEAHVAGKQVKTDYSVTLELRKASMHAIDDVARLKTEHEPASPFAIATPNRHLYELSLLGYVSLSSISAAKVHVNIAGDGKDTPQLVDVEFKNELFVIESCADSTQTLIAILNGLQPPAPTPTAEQYRTVVPLQQMMESFTGDAMVQDEDMEADDFMSNADLVEDDVPTNLEFVGSMYNSQSLPTDEELGDSLLGEDDLEALATPPLTRQRGDRALLESFQEKYEVTQGEEDFEFGDNYFKDSSPEGKGKARKWDSNKNQYHLSNEFKTPDAPLKVRVRDVNIIWNLYDGYDWPQTRSVISQAVDDVEARAEERRRKARDEDEEDDFVEEDFLFNSVWIGVPVKDEKGALARRINHDIDDLASETGSYATSTATRSTGATPRPRSATKSRRRLKLERSKHKKIAFSLMGVAVDLIVFPHDTGETINSVNVRVQDLEIFDHVPTSTWKKFVTCAINPSARELSRPMINLELVTVKPVTDLAASELVIKVIEERHRE
jgi:autophagy-related protein 2